MRVAKEIPGPVAAMDMKDRASTTSAVVMVKLCASAKMVVDGDVVIPVLVVVEDTNVQWRKNGEYSYFICAYSAM